MAFQFGMDIDGYNTVPEVKASSLLSTSTLTMGEDRSRDRTIRETATP